MNYAKFASILSKNNQVDNSGNQPFINGKVGLQVASAFGELTGSPGISKLMNQIIPDGNPGNDGKGGNSAVVKKLASPLMQAIFSGKNK